LGDEIKKNELGGACGTYGGMRVACRILVRKLEGKRPLGRPKCRLRESIKMHLSRNRVVECGLDRWS
jgi:hypothetical protein